MGQLKIDLLNTSFTIQANEDSEYLEQLYGYYKRIIEDVQQIDSVSPDRNWQMGVWRKWHSPILLAEVLTHTDTLGR